MIYLIIFSILMLIVAILELVLILKLRKNPEVVVREINVTPDLLYQRSDVVTLKTRLTLPISISKEYPEREKNIALRQALESLSEEFVNNPRLYKMEQAPDISNPESFVQYYFELKVVTTIE